MMYSVKQRQNPLDREADSKYYASAEYGEEIDVTKLAKEISKSCTLTPADVVAVIESFLDKMPEYLKSSNDIKNLRVLFTPSAELKRELSDVSYTRK